MNTQRFRGRVSLAVAGFVLLVGLGQGGAQAQIYRGKATRVGDDPPAGSNGDSVIGLSARFDDGGVLDPFSGF